MMYPLYLMNWDDIALRPTIEKSIRYWYSPNRPRGSDAGFTLAVASSFYSSMGKGDEALSCLQALLSAPTGIGKIMPNTMYAESGQNIETPLAAAQGVHDMLLQSWGDRIRIFPAVPASWKDLVFENLRAQGAFLISARMQDGALSWVRIKSLMGEPCEIQCFFSGTPTAYKSGKQGIILNVGPNCYKLDLKRGDEIVIISSRLTHRPEIAALQHDPKFFNHYGVHR